MSKSDDSVTVESDLQDSANQPEVETSAKEFQKDSQQKTDSNGPETAQAETPKTDEQISEEAKTTKDDDEVKTKRSKRDAARFDDPGWHRHFDFWGCGDFCFGHGM